MCSCHVSWGRGEDPCPCCSLAKASSIPSRCSAGAASHFQGSLEQREGLRTWRQSWAPHPYLPILAHGCLTSDDQIIFLSAVKYSLKPSTFCLVRLFMVGGQARAPGGHWGTCSFHHTWWYRQSLLKTTACKCKAPSPVTAPLHQAGPCSP